MVIRTKQDAARVLSDVEGDKRFFAQNGCVSKNLPELVHCLNTMPEESFRHHVTCDKNDFVNWVRDVLGDDTLAMELNKASGPADAGKIVAQRVIWLQKRLK